MRKLLSIALTFTFALAFMAGTALAQNNQAKIKQFDIPKGETTAKINQAGSQNYARIMQGIQTPVNRRGVKKSDALIKQSGPKNQARILQGRNQGFSAKSSAKIIQEGTNQQANNKAEIQQGVQKAAEKNNEARIRQNGSLNEAVIYQGVKGGGSSQSLKTEANTAITKQKGNRHYSEIRQGFGPGIETDNAVAKTMQFGDNHSAFIVQTGNGGMAQIKQSN